MKIYLLIFFFITVTCCVNAQCYEEIQIDSLQGIVENPATKDAERIDPLARLSKLYMYQGDSATAMLMLNRARKLASHEKESEYMIYVYNQELVYCLNSYPRKITLAYKIIDSIYMAIKKTSNLELQALGYVYIGETKYKINYPEYDCGDLLKSSALAKQLPEKSVKKYRVLYRSYYYMHLRCYLSNADSAKKYLDLAQDAAKKSGDKNYLCSAMSAKLLYDKLHFPNDKNLLAMEFEALENFISENLNKIQTSDYGTAVGALIAVEPLISNPQYIKKIDTHREILKEMAKNNFNTQYIFLTVEILYMKYRENYDEAIQLMHQKIKIDETIQPNLLSATYKDLSSLYYENKQYKQAAEALQQSMKYEYQYESTALHEQQQLGEVKIELEIQKQQIRMQRTANIITGVMAIVITAVLSLLLLLFNRKKKINRLEKEKADMLTKQALEKNVKLTEDLIINTNEMNRKDHLIDRIKDMTKEELGRALRKEQKQTMLINEYTKLFREIDSQFYQLLQQHAAPNHLSSTDLKYCAYISMRLNNKDLANVMNVEYKTVTSQKYRLKKKLHLSENDDLEEFICSLPTIFPIGKKS